LPNFKNLANLFLSQNVLFIKQNKFNFLKKLTCETAFCREILNKIIEALKSFPNFQALDLSERLIF